jgi:hypothetical protein
LNQVALTGLRLGALLAEGGEGRVFEVTAAPPMVSSQFGDTAAQALVFKQLRRPRPLAELTAVVGFPTALAGRDPGFAARAWSSSAWPSAAVVGDDPSLALGTLMRRAPARFWLRHRDGGPRPATLSYLASDPDRIAVAYGARVPAPGAPERVAVVYALCRLLDSWQTLRSPVHVVHGDISAKNVLWSLVPTPAVYVLDCDGATVGQSPAGEVGSCPGGATSPIGMPAITIAATASGAEPRSRAITPNWDDPAAAAGSLTSEATDRYTLGLVFLRVVGAANFPLQGRQRAGGRINVDLELPRSWRHLPDRTDLWRLCERALSIARAGERPSPAEWSGQLEELLDLLRASALAAQVRADQGDPRPSRAVAAAPVTTLGARPGAGPARAQSRAQPRVMNQRAMPPLPASGRLLVSAGTALAGDDDVRNVPGAGDVPDVVVRPVLRHRAPSTWQLINARPLSAGTSLAGPGAGGVVGSAPGPSVRQLLKRTTAAWGGAHRLAAQLVASRGRRWHGLRRTVGLLVLDLAAAAVAVFVFGMIVSPWIGL